MKPRLLPLALLVAIAPLVARGEDARLLAKLAGSSGTDVQFSRDGKLILTAGGNEAQVWDAKRFEPL